MRTRMKCDTLTSPKEGESAGQCREHPKYTLTCFATVSAESGACVGSGALVVGSARLTPGRHQRTTTSNTEIGVSF